MARARAATVTVVFAFFMIGSSCVVRSAKKPPPSQAGASTTSSPSLASSSEPPPPPAIPEDLLEPDPRSIDAFLASMEAPGKVLAAGAEGPQVVMIALENTAKALASAFSQGPVLSVELAEGERAQTQLSEGPGCFTVIGHGGLGVIELDLFATKPGEPSQILAQDLDVGPVAVLPNEGCVSLPDQSSIHVVARAGGGQVVVQVFQR